VLRKSLIVIALLSVACGKRGDPHPPVPVIPKAVSDLVVAQRGAKVILSWSFPSQTTAGQKLGDIRRIVVYRYTEELAAADIAKAPPIGPQKFARGSQRIDSIESADLPGATVGAKLVYEDAPPLRGRLTYGVVVEAAHAKSALSNLAAVVPVSPPPGPPDSVTAAARPEGIVLSWKGSAAGYNVYRTAPNQTIDELTPPINPSPVANTTYTDTPAYGTYQYVVTSLASTGKQAIESDPSAPVTAEFKDLQAPPTPTGLTALVETNAVRLVWDAVDAPDLAGYRIWRTEGAGIEKLTPVGKVPLVFDHPLTQMNYTDATVKAGISYFYEVSAVDKSGNESKPAKTDWVLVPRTP